ncbi:MAG TPA: helix-turn-helix domain-containing protein [Solirubrobacterales bacterium]|nr:helix-turn-helix domain-containing protein [Solirubrobacterales bacterium]
MPTHNGHSLNGHSGSREIPVNAAENGRPGSPSIPVNWENLARATAHPLRVSILEILGLDGGRVLSPSDLSHELQIPLSNTNYHVTELAKSGLIELVRERQVRGATEHFYRLPAAAQSGESETSEAEAEPEEDARPPLAAAA